jgi:murein DD-endopeptidase MepM/ murein hydrolase activator NlpD
MLAHGISFRTAFQIFLGDDASEEQRILNEHFIHSLLLKYMPINEAELTSNQLKLKRAFLYRGIKENKQQLVKSEADVLKDSKELAPILKDKTTFEKAVSKSEKELKQLAKEEDALLRKIAVRSGVRNSLQWPVSTVHNVSGFGKRPAPIAGVENFHNGVDLVVPTGTKVYSVMPGIVVTASANGISGNYIIIRHANGYYSYYAHLSVIHVEEGQMVDSLQLIAKSGSTGAATGPHLHLSIATGIWKGFVDPIKVMPKDTANPYDETKLAAKEKDVKKEELKKIREELLQ